MFAAIGVLQENLSEPIPSVQDVYSWFYDYYDPELPLTHGEQIEIAQEAPGRGVIYLTFDDGPGPYTAQLLDVLAKYNIKATFFVTGAGSDDLILREYNEGHTVALHTLSHNYAAIYQNVDAYFADLYAVQDRVRRITGQTATLIRFPGGSSNLVSAKYDGGAKIMSRLAQEVEAKGFTYFDWNISSGDAGGVTTADGVYNTVVNGLVGDGDMVVLQHDIKKYSVDAVERIIKYGLDNGWSFDKLTAESFTAHHRINNWTRRFLWYNGDIMEGKKSRPRAILIFGAPCSGKTTFAEKFAAKFDLAYYNFDETRERCRLTRKNLLMVLELICRTGKTLVIEGGLDTEKDRAEIRNVLRSSGYEPSLVWVQTDMSTIRMRMKSRFKSVSAARDAYDAAIERMEAPAEMEHPIILSGKHTFETQTKHILAGLADSEKK